MNTVLFVVFPAISHYNSCFGLADDLRKRDYRVVFTGRAEIKSYVEENGFEFVTLHYIYDYKVPYGFSALKTALANRLYPSHFKKRYREFVQTVSDFHSICESLRPNEIYLDEHLNHYYPLSKCKVEFVYLINTKLPTRRVSGIPPLTCGTPVRSSIWGKIYSWFRWEVYLSGRQISKWISNFVYNGQTSTKWLNRLSGKLGFQYIQESNNAFYDCIANVPIIHVVPRQMEYEWYSSHIHEQFVFHVYEQRISSNKSIFTGNEFKDLRNISNVQIIYCSLGTLSGLYSKPAIRFFQKLIRIASMLQDVHLIISATGHRSFLLDAVPENVSVYDWVPQLEVLTYCNAMITHGGMNSISECILKGVPMLVYPLNLNSDQPGNAARVKVNGWGLNGNLRRCSDQQLLNAINEVLLNNHYRQQILKTHSELRGV